MPKIPAYQRRETIPGVSGNVKADASSFGQMGKVIAGVGETIANEAMRMREEERHYSTVRIGNMVNDDALNFERTYQEKMGLDAYGSREAVDKWKNDAVAKFTKDLHDQKIRLDVEQHIGAQANQLLGSLSRHEARQRDLVAEDTRFASLEGAVRSAYQGFGTLDENMQIYNKVIANDPRLRDTDRENKLMAGQSAIAWARLDGMIDRNPDAAEEMLKAGLFEQYLDSDKLQKLNDKIEQARKDRKAQEKEAERLRKEELKEQQRAVGDDFAIKFIEGRLFGNEIKRSILDPTGENSKMYWMGKIKERAKSAAAGEWKTNKGLEAELFTKIVENPEMPDDEILNKVGKGLTVPAARTLLNDKKARQAKEIDPLKTDEAKYATAQLGFARTAKMFSDIDEENYNKWVEASKLLRQFIVNHPDEDASEFVAQLVEKEKDGFIDRVFNKWNPTYQTPTERKKERVKRMAAPEEGEPKPGMPTLEQFLERAREKNPGISDDALTQYYQDKYGNR